MNSNETEIEEVLVFPELNNTKIDAVSMASINCYRELTARKLPKLSNL